MVSHSAVYYCCLTSSIHQHASYEAFEVPPSPISKKSPQPFTPQPPPPVTVPVVQLLARVFPHADFKARNDALRQLVQGEGSKQAALAVLQYAYNNLNLYPVEGAKRPPADVALKSIDIGPHTIFYHRTYPVEVQAAHPFLWSFYIGHAGKGRGSIIADCAQENVVFSIQSGRGKWQNISTLVVLPRTTIRVSYLDSRGAATQEELVFPSDPREAPITSHYTSYIKQIPRITLYLSDAQALG
ncbi:hypothetical protein B0H14DRAFT_3865406 [Mycena olivaceomarginata]|nr:hypothetical protein B0H14DRAFT_3865406 [Mycena olivaceomarginata]